MSNIAWEFINKEITLNLFFSEMDFICSHLRKSEKEAVSVAVSGGSDSMALLLLINHWCIRKNTALTCITVDHNLRSESAYEALFIKNFCENIGIKHTTLKWIRPTEKISIGKIENMARDARYNLINEFCNQHSIKIVATGHTWNDQLETYEMRKAANSSEFGLAGMSKIRSISKNVKIIRPLMVFTKKHLRDFLNSEKVSWKDDPMNENENFKRVSIRKNLSELNQNILLAKSSEIKLLGKKRREIEENAVRFFQNNINPNDIKFGFITFDTQKFLAENDLIKPEILKRAIWNIGGKKYTSNIDDNILKQIFTFKKLNTIGKCFLKINKKYISIFRENRNLDEILIAQKNKHYIFDNRFSLFIKCDKFQNELTKFMVLSVKRLGKLCSNSELPHEAIYSLPCVCVNESPVFVYGSDEIFSENITVKCEFINKVGLFDIFL
ncbi:MAG: tRNA lysidine(34) synthetase TilS [Alphaproteobacteria bacterium]|nr:tRNA lysidine(34) synthetase TilS [Alphaproteobacteria bacterium]